MDRIQELLELQRSGDLTEEQATELEGLLRNMQAALDGDEGDEETPDITLTPEQGRRLQDALENLGTVVEERAAGAVESTLEGVENLVQSLRGQRSRRPPVPRGTSGRRQPAQHGQAQGREGRGEAMASGYAYTRMELRDGTYDLYRELHEKTPELKYRDPRIDNLSRQWLIAFYKNHAERADRIGRELNDRYLENRGAFMEDGGRAALLEGDPDASSGFADGSGGELLPLPLQNQMILARNKASKLRSLVMRQNMTSQTSRTVVGPTVTATQVAEGATAADGTPNPTSVLLSAKKTQVRFSASRELLEDSAFNVVNFFAERAGAAIGEQEDVQMCTSQGTAPDYTESLQSASITDIAETTASTIGLEDIYALYYGVPEQYRRGASFLAASTTLQDIVNIMDSNGRPVLLDGLSAPVALGDLDPAAEGTILRKPVYDVPLADDIVFFGNLDFYTFGDRAGIRVRASEHVRWAEDVIDWIIDERADGLVGLADAFRKVIY